MDLPPPKARFCLAVLQNHRGEILLLRRARSDDFAPGLWGLPGGHMRADESPEQTLRRELREELGETLELRLLRRAGPVRDTWYGGIYEVHLFLYDFMSGTLRLNAEHETSVWVSADVYRRYSVVDGVDEDLAYLEVWPLAHLNGDKLPQKMKGTAPSI